MRVRPNATDVTTYFKLVDPTTGDEEVDLVITDLDISYVRDLAVAVKADLTALAGATDADRAVAAHADNKGTQIDKTNCPGLYRIDWPDAAFATAVAKVQLVVAGAAIDTAMMEVEIDASLGADSKNLISTDAQDLAATLSVNTKRLGGVEQSATDLKDFADTGYDPSTHKVAGVVLADTTTTNSDMVAAAPTTAQIVTAMEAGGTKLAAVHAVIPATAPPTNTQFEARSLATADYATDTKQDTAQTAINAMKGTDGKVVISTDAQDLKTTLTVGSYLKGILATALTETGGYLAAGFKKFFNVATPVATAETVNQTGDAYAVVAHADHGNAQLVRSTTPANKLDVSATGEAGLDFNNIKAATGATTLTNITVPIVTTVGTTTTNTDMRGTNSAALATTLDGMKGTDGKCVLSTDAQDRSTTLHVDALKLKGQTPFNTPPGGAFR